MNPSPSSGRYHQLASTCFWTLIAIGSFALGQNLGIGAWMVLFLFSVLQLSTSASWRRTLYPLLLIGLVSYGIQLQFFWTIFGAGACILWLLLAMWLPIFGLIVRVYIKRLNWQWQLVLVPVLWMGLEYLRSEVYGLRFTWLTLGSSFWATPASAHGLGVYGLGFIIALVAALFHYGFSSRKWGLGAIGSALTFWLVVICPLGNLPLRGPVQAAQSVEVAGLQLEFPSEAAVLAGLDGLVRQRPDAQLLVLSEYTFPGPVPKAVLGWCKRHHHYLAVGGTEPLGNSEFYNIVYVIGPQGKVVFQQAKSRPIQFFKDGKAAEQRRVWHSPWGPIGIMICFDLSYAQVADDLVAQGAKLLIVPTMDVRGWGQKEHELNARAASLRAAEYGIPIFRLCSSGISEVVEPSGTIRVAAPFPGQGEIIGANISMNSGSALPVDRFMAPVCTGLTVLLILGLGLLPRYPKRENSS